MDELEKAFDESFKPEVYDKVNTEIAKSGLGPIKDLVLAGVSLKVPLIRLVQPVANLYHNFKEQDFLNKFVDFYFGLANSQLSAREVNAFYEGLEDANRQDSAQTMLGIIERIDNINKVTVLNNLLMNCAYGHYPHAQFLRLTTALERAPYVDLLRLPSYREDHYEAGAAEMLFACGLVSETVIGSGTYGADESRNENHSRFGLTPLGEDMLRYGLMHIEYSYMGQGKHLTDLDWYEAD